MLSLTFLGTGAAIPTLDRNVSALAIQREGETLLFDCGEATQRQMMRYGVGFTLRDVFFTHYHSDHILGLTGLGNKLVTVIPNSLKSGIIIGAGIAAMTEDGRLKIRDFKTKSEGEKI